MMTLMPNTGSQAHNQATRTSKPQTPIEYGESRWQLLHQLHSTLDVELVLTYFFKCLQQQAAVNSLLYSHSSQHIEVELGTHGSHCCDYNLNTESELLGSIRVTRCKRFSEKELEEVESLLGILMLPLRNALHYRAALQTALHDPLTGIKNRVAMESTLEREMMLAERHQQPLSVLVLDLDHFKHINDTLGHCAGDTVLTHVAKLMKQTCRNSDICYRYGGEEFVILLSNTDSEGAKLIAERIRRVIAQTPVVHDDNEIHITASVGISHYHKGDNTHSLFERADKAMYIAKSAGRNCIADSVEK